MAGSGAAWWGRGPVPVGAHRDGLAAGLRLAATTLMDGGTLTVVTDGQESGPEVLGELSSLAGAGVIVRVVPVPAAADLRLHALRVPMRARPGERVMIEAVVAGRSPGLGPAWLTCGGSRKLVTGPGIFRFRMTMPDAPSLLVKPSWPGKPAPSTPMITRGRG